jgi:hypothetical protein
MTTPPEDTLMHAVWAPARSLDSTEAEIAAVLARFHPRAHRPARGHRPPALRFVATSLAALFIVAAGGYTVPTTRAAMQDVLSRFGGYFSGVGGSPPPGRPLRPTDAPPPWLRTSSATGQRVIAESDGIALYMVREPGGTIAFQLDRNVGFSDSPQGWSARLRDHAIAVLGPGGGDEAGRSADGSGRRPVFGLAAGSVAGVELRYSDGTALRSGPVDGAFVLLADPHRRPRTLTAFDRAGHEIDAVTVDLW